jgi:hypothetical protein
VRPCFWAQFWRFDVFVEFVLIAIQHNYL